MKIQIANYSDFEVVQTGIVLFRGFIEDEKVVEKLEIDVRQTSTNCSTDFGSDSIRIVCNAFSVIICLFEGLNEIGFHFNGHVVHRAHLIYKLVNNSNQFIVKPLIVRSNESIDSTPLPENIQVGLKLIQWYFSEKLVEAGYPRRSFVLGSCSEFRFYIPPTKIQKMNSDEVWEELAKQIRSSNLWNEKYKYVAFLLHSWKVNSTSDGSYALEPRSAVSTGGLALLDHKLCSFWPNLVGRVFPTLESNAENPDDTSVILGTVGRHFGASLGIVAHELGHAFDLGHERRGLMGKDYHRFALTFLPKIKSILNLRSKKVYLSSGDICEDPVQLGGSFLKLLQHNRWFSQEQKGSSVDSEVVGRIHLEKNLISSSFGISVIEVRAPDSGLVLASWIGSVNSNTRQKTFPLSKRFVEQEYSESLLELLVQDVTGTIFRGSVNFSHLPEGPTSIRRTIYC